jgi:hypothetical protein
VLIDDIRNHLAVMNVGQRERRTAVLLREAADHIDSLRQEVRTQRLEIAALREERRALVEADRRATATKIQAAGGSHEHAG